MDCAEAGLLPYTVVFVAAVVAGLVLVLVLLEVARRRLPVYVQWRLARLWRASNPPNKLKIAAGYYMIITKIDTVYQADMPASVRAMLEPFRLSVTLGMGSTNDVLACVGVTSFLGRLGVWMLLPVVLVLVLVFGCVCWLGYRRELTRHTLLSSSLPLITRLLFVLYPLVTNVAFEAFSCYDFDGDAAVSNSTVQSFLVSDVSVPCYREEHGTITGVAWLALFLYPLGIICIFAALLLHARKAILAKRPTLLSQAVRFLYREYQPDFYYWEIMEMLRRVVLVGFMVLVQRGTIVQVHTSLTLYLPTFPPPPH